MTAHNKQALREAAQEEIMLRSVSDTSDSWQDEASPEAVLALLDELEKEKGYASAFEAEKWHYHGLAESEGERADRAEKALEAAENRIAELEAREVKLPQRMGPEGYHIDEAYLVAAEDGDYFDRDEVIEALTAAGIGIKGGE
ncbi:ead/Ea22-like family protein [Citrobacter freundii]|uniref:ead/Ea22-like family protein n=1 Tax=Citrobacter freundii TaxID=546 RepID=UPI003F9DC3C6